MKPRARTAAIDQPQGRSVENGIDVIGQWPCRALAQLLSRQCGIGDAHGQRQRGLRIGARDGAAAARHGGPGVHLREIEHRGQVARHGAPPGRDVRLMHAEARLQEADHRGYGR
ncbi:MAG: hypothetical protein WDN03_09945 [Rhizomicrobium sp.]